MNPRTTITTLARRPIEEDGNDSTVGDHEDDIAEESEEADTASAESISEFSGDWRIVAVDPLAFQRRSGDPSGGVVR